MIDLDKVDCLIDGTIVEALVSARLRSGQYGTGT